MPPVPGGEGAAHHEPGDPPRQTGELLRILCAWPIALEVYCGGRAGLSINHVACYDNLEINRADTTKRAALAELCGALGIAAAEVMAFGDSENDVEMLIWAGRSFTMANAEPAALAAASFHTASNQNGGVVQALECCVLGRKQRPVLHRSREKRKHPEAAQAASGCFFNAGMARARWSAPADSRRWSCKSRPASP